MAGILNLIRLIPIFYSLIVGTALQARFANKLLSKSIKDYPLDPNGKPKDRVISKMYTYGAVAYFSVLEYAKLFDRKVTNTEREITTIINAMIIGYDELIDHYETNDNDLSEMINNPDEYQAQNYLEQIIINLYKDILDKVPQDRQKDIREIFSQVNDIQVKSKLQRDPNTSLKKIEAITLTKGGSTVVLYLQLLNWIKDDKLFETFFDLGGWLQLNDDKSDYKKDLEQGVITLYTYPNNYKNADQLNEKLQKHVFSKIMALQFPDKKKRHLLYVFFVIVTLHNAYVLASAQKSKAYKFLNQNGIMSSFITMLLSIKYCYKTIYNYNYNQSI